MTLPLTTPESRLRRILYVGGLSEEVTEDVLRAAFLPFGDIREVHMPKERSTGACRRLKLRRHRGWPPDIPKARNQSRRGVG